MVKTGDRPLPIWSWDEQNTAWIHTHEGGDEDVARLYESAAKFDLTGSAFVASARGPRKHPMEMGVPVVGKPESVIGFTLTDMDEAADAPTPGKAGWPWNVRVAVACGYGSIDADGALHVPARPVDAEPPDPDRPVTIELRPSQARMVRLAVLFGSPDPMPAELGAALAVIGKAEKGGGA